MISDSIRSLATWAAKHDLWVRPIPPDRPLNVYAGEVMVGEMPAGEFFDLRRRIRREWGTLPVQIAYWIMGAIRVSALLMSQTLHAMVFGTLAGIVGLAFFADPQILFDMFSVASPVTPRILAVLIQQYFIFAALFNIVIRFIFCGGIGYHGHAGPWDRVMCAVLKDRFNVNVPAPSVWRIGSHDIFLRQR